MTNNKKTAVVIGATGNLGHSLCKLLSQNGYQIDKTWLKKNHPDATIPKSYKDLPNKINLAVYLAGLNKIAPVNSLELTDWNRVIEVNLTGAFLLAKYAFAGLKKAKGSTFIVISSINTTHPYPHRIAYTSSKTALEGLTRSLAIEWGKYKISTHCIRLGHMTGLMKTTPANPNLLKAAKYQSPLKKLIDPSDVASLILWLSEKGSNSISGDIIDFDPAYTINRWPLDSI